MRFKREGRSTTVKTWLVVLVLGLVAAACGGGGNGEQGDGGTADPGTATDSETATETEGDEQAGEAIELRYNFIEPEGSPQYEDMVSKFAEIVNDLSGGRITVEEYGSCSLIECGEDVAGLQQGLADIAAIEPNYNIGALPNSKASDLPLIFENHAMAADVLYQIVSDSESALSQHFAERELKVLWPAVYPGAQLISNTSVQTLGDMEGLSVRGPGGVVNDTLSAMGAEPTSITPGEVYTSLDTGVVDGAVWALIALDSFGLHEVVKNLTLFGDSGLYYGVAFNTMSQERWDELDSDAQDVLLQAAEQMVEVSKEAVAKWDSDTIDNMEAADVEIVEFQDLEEARNIARDLWDTWAEQEEGRRAILDEQLQHIEEYSGG